jgi:hypothetical protein
MKDKIVSKHERMFFKAQNQNNVIKKETDIDGDYFLVTEGMKKKRK